MYRSGPILQGVGLHGGLGLAEERPGEFDNPGAGGNGLAGEDPFAGRAVLGDQLHDFGIVSLRD